VLSVRLSPTSLGKVGLVVAVFGVNADEEADGEMGSASFRPLPSVFSGCDPDKVG
jgi:hypothetical protein